MHGNGEDLGQCYSILQTFRNKLKINVVGIEYPGYGVFSYGTANEKTINYISLNIFNYVKQFYDLNKIIVCGRSIGTKPALNIASKHKIGGLILLSPFTSLKNIIYEKYGGIASYLIQEKATNEQLISSVSSNTNIIIIHGKDDQLINCQHSLQLLKKIKHKNKNGFLVQKMDHNNLFCEHNLLKILYLIEKQLKNIPNKNLN